MHKINNENRICNNEFDWKLKLLENLDEYSKIMITVIIRFTCQTQSGLPSREDRSEWKAEFLEATIYLVPIYRIILFI